MAAPVPFRDMHDRVPPRLDKAIFAAAESHSCDVIVMVSHGHGDFGTFETITCILQLLARRGALRFRPFSERWSNFAAASHARRGSTSACSAMLPGRWCCS